MKRNTDQFYLINLLLFKKRGSLNKGATLSELLLGTLIASTVISLAAMSFSWLRQMYVKDQQRNDVNQTLRSVFEIVGSDVRQAGEGFAQDPNFPSIVITENSGNSEISIRRSLLTTSLPVCRQIVSGTSDNVLVVDDTSSIAGCDLIDDDNNGWPDSLQTWKDYRLSNGTTIRAFIYDGAGNGEFFKYYGEETFQADGSAVTPSPGAVASGSLNTNNHTWQNTYGNNSASRIYLIEERRYRLQGDTLQLVINDDVTQTSSVVGNLETFNVIAHIQQDLLNNSYREYTCTVIPPVDSTSCSGSLVYAYAWSQIKFIEIKPKALIYDNYSSSIKAEQSQKVFPRNVLNY